jgi:cytochrome P450
VRPGGSAVTPAGRGATPGSPAVRRNARYTVLDADGPTPRDMLRDLPAIRRDPLAYLEAVVARFGPVVAFPLPRTPVLLVDTSDGARRVLQDNHRGYGKQTVQYGALSLVTGSGLLTTDGQVWRRRRRLAQPAFHRSGLPAVAEQSVAAARRVVAAWDDAGPGAAVDVEAACLRATLEVVGRTLFGADVGRDAAEGERVVAAVGRALEVVVQRARTPLPLPGWVPTPSARRLRAARATIDGACLRLIADRRARGGPAPVAGAAGPDATSAGPGDDLLGLLLRAGEAEGEGLTDAELRDELVTLVIAGHETVASCLTWTLHLLARHPEQQAAVHAELDAVLGGADGRPPAWDDLEALVRVRAVVEESLRLYPPAWVVTRTALADDVVAGVAIPAGTLVILSPWLLHRQADVWERPQVFDPGRFVGGAAAGVPRGAYVPFGAGPRLCIGRDFALVESVLVLAELLRSHRVEAPAGPPPRVDALVTLRPHGGLPLLLERR